MPAEVRPPPRRSGSGDVGPQATITAPKQQVRRSKRPVSGDDGLHIEGSGDVDRRQVALLRKSSSAVPPPDAMKKSKQMRSTGGDLLPPITISVKGAKGRAPVDGTSNGTASIRTGTTATLSSGGGSGSNPTGGRRTKTGITSRSYRQPAPPSASAGASGEHRRTKSSSGDPQLVKKKPHTNAPSASSRRPGPSPASAPGPKGPPPRRAESGGGNNGSGRHHAKQPPPQSAGARRPSATKPRGAPSGLERQKTPSSPGRHPSKTHQGGGTAAHSSPSSSNRSPSVRNSGYVRERKTNTSPPPPPVLQTEPALQSALDEKFQDSGLEVVTSTSSYGAMPNIRPLQSSRDVGVPMATVRYGGEKQNTKPQDQVGPASDDVVAAKLADFEEQLKGVGGENSGGRQRNTKRNNNRSTSRSSSHSGGSGYGGDRETEQEGKTARRGTKKDKARKSRSSKDIKSSSRLSSIRQDLAASATGAAAATEQSQPKHSLLRRLSSGPKEMFRRLSNGNLMAAGAGNNDDDINDEAPDRTNLVVDTSAGGHSPSDDSSDVSTISATAVSADQQALLAKYLLEAGNAANEAEAAQIAAKYARAESSSNHGGQPRKKALNDDGMMSKFAQFHADDDQEDGEMWAEMDAKAAIARGENPGLNDRMLSSKFLVGEDADVGGHGGTAAGRASPGGGAASDWLPKDHVIEESGYGNYRSSNEASDLAEKGIVLASVSARANERSASSSSEEYVDWKAVYRHDRMENDQDRGQGHRGSGMDDTAHTSAAVDGTDRRQGISQSIASSFRRPGRRRMRYERAQRPGAVQMRGRAQGQLPVWSLNGLRHQQTLQREAECEIAATQPNEHVVEAIAVTDDDRILEGDVVYANAESMPSGVKLFFKDRNARICFAVSLLALIGGIVGISVWLPSRSQGTAIYVHDGSPTNMPTAAPTVTMAPTVDLSPILNVLGKYSSMEDLRRRGSPQNSAMRWMLYEDTDHEQYQHTGDHHVWEQEYLDPHTLQRYTTAVLYFALHECTNAWESDKDTWLQPFLHECDWGRGISCQTYAGNQFIVALDLGKVGACGKIPPEIGYYDKLGSLILDGNEIYGPIVDEFCQLKSLKVLSMGSNRIEGTFPECIGREMTSLTTLDLSNNLLQNTFPDSFFKLRHLRVLDLSQNSISGTISNDLLPDLKALTIANIASNQFSGTLPSSFDTLPDLAYMHLDNNLFSGSIPSFTTFLGRREAITLSNNLLTGTIPAKIPEQTDLFGGSVNPADFRMATLDISQNLISGSIPPLVGFIPSLKYVDYSSNDLTGTLPQTLGRFGLMTKVEYISVANNQFEGPIITLGYPESTRHIDVSNNQKLEGGFPSFLLDYKALEYLDLSNNNFKGELPEKIGNLKSLLYFGAKDCGLSGSIPSSLGSLGQVTQVDISENALSSSIPTAMGMMNSLRVFQANSNALTGSIPTEFASLKNLESLNLEGNKLDGEVPEGVCNLGLKTIGIDCTVQCACCDGECSE